MKSCGIVSQLTPPYTSQHNGGDALEYVTRILNMIPTKKVDKTPYELWHGKDPILSCLKETTGYYFYNPDENKIFIARYAEFFENSLTSQEASGSNVDLEIIQNEDHNEVEHEDVEPRNDIVPIRRSNRIPQAPYHYGFYANAKKNEFGDLIEPPNYKAALSDLESDKWVKAMNAEMQSMKDNQFDSNSVVMCFIFNNLGFYSRKNLEESISSARTLKMSESENHPPASSVTVLRIPIIKKGQPSAHSENHSIVVNARRNNEKALNILLSAIPDRHLLSFHDAQDARSLWAAIKARFGGNKESKKQNAEQNTLETTDYFETFLLVGAQRIVNTSHTTDSRAPPISRPMEL
ncbi:retrotransposon protein, putative, ty1-copia subclass [Tanacetum coccineum]